MGRRLCFTIAERKYYARMQDTPLAGQVAAMCPFEQRLAYLGEFEEDVSQLLQNEKGMLLIRRENVPE